MPAANSELRREDYLARALRSGYPEAVRRTDPGRRPRFVLGELARQLTWSDEPIRLYHYRDRDQYEVDAILERASGEVVAIEVKAAETVRSDDFRGIRHLQRRIGEQLSAGLVLYAGGQSLSFGDRLRRNSDLRSMAARLIRIRRWRGRCHDR